MSGALDSWQSVFDYFIQHEKVFLRYTSYTILLYGIVSGLLLQCIVSPYGRHSAASWGPLLNARLAWLAQELPAFVIPVLLLLYADCPQLANASNQILIGMYFVHYGQRTFLYPYLMKGAKPYPTIIFFFAVTFCAANGYLQVRSLTRFTEHAQSWTSDIRFLSGVVLFLVGFGINVHSDHILRSLRKPGETGYKIPTGGLFRYVSGANFLGEIIEWTGFACAAWNLPSLAFAAFSLLNLAPRAMQHHRWYQKKFENYPKERRGIIPFVL